jgi:hypothetical protein
MRMVYVLRISLLLMFDWFCMMWRLALGEFDDLSCLIYFFLFSSVGAFLSIPSFAQATLWDWYFFCQL